ncbi:glycosyltransferase [Georgenia sp. M64]|uniref:glycosyltransferase n=1 Tax=Georgenia sp. M64 TaxID=3120520 RepID=UPI0030E1ED7B
MRILIISYHYPPAKAIGGARVEGFARSLLDAGHDVRVVTAGPSEPSDERATAIPPEKVFRAAHLRRSSRAQTVADDPGGNPSKRTSSAPFRKALKRWLYRLYQRAIAVPDTAVDWALSARALGRNITRNWKPDIILVSGPPFSAIAAAVSLKRLTRAALVVDYRDPWTLGAYYPFGAVRRTFDRQIELFLGAHFDAITTVSSPIAELLHDLHGLRASVILNGYDEGADSFPRESEAQGPLSSARLNILYVGNALYAGRRDPSPLFLAARELQLSPDDVRIHFLGTDSDTVLRFPGARDIEDLLVFHPPVSHQDSLAFQRRADLLLLLLWNNPAERGVYSGKLFEYIGSGRPVLLIGYQRGVAAALVEQERFGFVTTDKDSVIRVLRRVLDGPQLHFPDSTNERRKKYSRDKQNKALIQLVTSLHSNRHAQ